MLARARGFAFTSLSLLACSCASTPRLRFVPPVQDVELRDGSTLEARVTLAWRGLAEVERDGREGHELRLRLRVENPSGLAFSLAGAEFELLDGALVPFGPARLGELPASVEPGQEATFDVAFPVPEGKTLEDLDLSALQFRASFQGGRWSFSQTFQRVHYDPYHDPYWGPAWGWHFGLGVRLD